MGDQRLVAGSNSAELTPEQRRTLFFEHYRPISAAREKVKSAKIEEKRLRKLAKADGIVLADVDFAMRCAEVEDPDIVVDELSRRTAIASWMALPVDYQPELFGPDEREPIEDKAFRAGVLAASLGKNGDPKIDGYDLTSAAGQAWMKGWNEEQGSMREAARVRMEATNAEKAAAAAAGDAPKPKRGRPRKPNLTVVEKPPAEPGDAFYDSSKDPAAKPH